jgi:uncharacterized repeat protein (TIGR01451 family)
VDCDSGTIGNQNTVNLAAAGDPGASAQCSYSTALPDGTDRTNTATATYAGHGYTGSAAVSFVGVSPTVTDDSASLSDDLAGLSGVFTASGSAGPSSADTLTCGEDEGTYTNTATLTEVTSDVNRTDSAQITVNCYELSVTKTAVEAFDRTFDWSVDKLVSTDGTTFVQGPLTVDLFEDQSVDVYWKINVTKGAAQDSGHRVSGVITVTNPAPVAVNGVVVTDALTGGINATVDCDSGTIGNQNTVDLAAAGDPGASAQCSYSTALPDGTDRTNTATATYAGHGYTGTAAANFGSATISEIDECVEVVDDRGTPSEASDDIVLDTALCANELTAGSHIFHYLVWIGTDGSSVPPGGIFEQVECGDNRYDNIATATANDTSTEVSDNAVVLVTVNCDVGCTLTLGYWKTHNVSFWGGVPADDTWLLIGPLAELTPFYLSGDTWFGLFWTSPEGGNAYYQLAHQYMAAKLNILNGASAPASVTSAITAAEAWFAATTPAQAAELKGKAAKDVRTWASTLAQYNEGLIGPGHCDEDWTSTLAFVLPALGLLGFGIQRGRHRRRRR